MTDTNSLFSAAKQFIPGGVNSPVRSFSGVGGTPVFIDHASGAYIFDAQGKQYIDYVGSWGPMVLGHAHPEVIAAVQAAAAKGLSFGAPTEIETLMAEKVCQLVPSMDLVRMVSSGTEATMSAIRLARGYTGRDKIVKFAGCYHGHADSLLVKAGSGALTFGVPSSPGVPASVAQHTLTLPYNDSEAVEDLFAECGSDIACIIVEPVAGNMNCIPPVPGFLETLRKVCDEYQSVLIFDEVMTGFRLAKGGVQELEGITPDLTCMGKVIGGGLPVGAFGGRVEIMDMLAPDGPVYQAGTLSGNPVAMAAGLAQLREMDKQRGYEKLEEIGQMFEEVVLETLQKKGLGYRWYRKGSMFCLFFTEREVHDLHDAKTADLVAFRKFFHYCLEHGVYFAPSQFETGFMSLAHSPDDILQTAEVAAAALASL